MEFIGKKENSKNDNFIRLYENFINYFQDQINNLSFIKILIIISKQYYSINKTTNRILYILIEYENAINFLHNVCGGNIPIPPGYSEEEERKNENNDEYKESEQVRLYKESQQKIRRIGYECYIVVLSEICSIYLLMNRNEMAQKYLDEATDYFNKISCSEPYIYSCYHRVSSQYYLTVGPPELYFSNTLSYISYTPVDEILPEDRITISVNISIAALIGKNIYNFGEILQAPVFKHLINTPYQWLYDLINVINEGNIDNFNIIIGEHMKDIQSQSALSSKLDVIKQKAVIMALLQLIFNKPTKNRVISFDEVCKATKMPMDQVEYIVMRAMSHDLIKGEIDQVKQLITITYLKPKVLTIDEIRSLSKSIGVWIDNIHHLYVDIEDHAKTLFA